MARFTQEQYDALLAKRATAHPPRPPQASGGEPQRPAGHESVGKESPEAKGPGRCFIRITSRRRRLIDPRANLYGGTKYLEDACVYAGILHDDKEAFSEGDVRQEKVGKDEEESTVIEIWRL